MSRMDPELGPTPESIEQGAEPADAYRVSQAFGGADVQLARPVSEAERERCPAPSNVVRTPEMEAAYWHDELAQAALEQYFAATAAEIELEL